MCLLLSFGLSAQEREPSGFGNVGRWKAWIRTGTITFTNKTLTSPTITGTGAIAAATFTASTSFLPDAADGAVIGTAALEFSDAFFADGAVLNFGLDQDVTLTHVADAALMLNAAMALRFRDATLLINSSVDGQLDIDADTEIELTATTVDLNGILDVSGVITSASEATFLSNAAAATFGNILTDSDVVIDFDAVTSQGKITYMEDEDRFDFDNDVDVIGDLTAATIASDAAVTAVSGMDLGTSQALVGTTGLTVGDGTQTVDVNSSDWNIGATGVMTGIGAITADGAIDFSSTRTAGSNIANMHKITLNAGDAFTGTTGHQFKVYDADNSVVHNGGEHTAVYANMKLLSAMAAGGKSVLYSGHNYGSGGDYQIIDAGVWLYGNFVDAFKISGGSIAEGLDLSETTVTTCDVHMSSGAYLMTGSADPNGSVTAPDGSVYIRTGTSTANTTVYVNTNGGTSWSALGTG